MKLHVRVNWLLLTILSSVILVLVYSLAVIPVIVNHHYSPIIHGKVNIVNFTVGNSSAGGEGELMFKLVFTQYNLTRRVTGSCRGAYNYTMSSPVIKSGTWLHYNTVNQRETSYPYIIYDIPVNITIKPPVTQGGIEKCRVKINVTATADRITSIGITNWAENTTGNTVHVSLNIEILATDKNVMHETQILLFFMLLAFYVYDLGVYIAADTHGDPGEILGKTMEQVQADAPVLYTVTLPFIAYLLSLKPPIPLEAKNNIPGLISFSLVSYTILHYTIITLLNHFKHTQGNREQYTAYHTLNIIVIAIFITALLAHHQTRPPAEIAAATYTVLLLRNILAIILSAHITKHKNKQGRSITYTP